MPVPAAINSGWQLTIVGRQEGQETNNVFNFTCTGESTDVETDLILVFINCFIDNLLPVLSSSWTLEGVRWKQTTPALGPVFTTVPAGAGPGAGNAAALPTTSAALFGVTTTQGGASHRGRFYLCGVPEAATLNSKLDTSHAFWAGAIAFAACVVAAFIVGDPPATPSFQMTVYSRKLGGASFPYNTAGYSNVAAITPKQVIATMRSRRLGRGI